MASRPCPAARGASTPSNGGVARTAAARAQSRSDRRFGPSQTCPPCSPVGAPDRIRRSRQRNLVTAGREGLQPGTSSDWSTCTPARQEEWSEFDADCRKYLGELDKEERLGKYTLAELEEEEQSLDRLRRWYRELRAVICSASPRRRTHPPPSSCARSGSRPTPTMCTRPLPAQATDLAIAEGSITSPKKIKMFTPKDWLDRLFQIGIIVKGLNGLAELVGGLLLLFATPGSIHHLVVVLTQGELSEDPDDIVARCLHTRTDSPGAPCCSVPSTCCCTALSRSSW